MYHLIPCSRKVFEYCLILTSLRLMVKRIIRHARNFSNISGEEKHFYSINTRLILQTSDKCRMYFARY